MLFVPQAPMETPEANYIVDPGYMMCMVPPAGDGAAYNLLQQTTAVAAKAAGDAAGPMPPMPPGEWDWSAIKAAGGFLGAAGLPAGGGARKGLAIRNPKTGEVIGGGGYAAEAELASVLEYLGTSTEQCSEKAKTCEDQKATALTPPAKGESAEEIHKRKVASARRALLGTTNLTNVLLSAASMKGGAAAKVLAKRRQTAMWCTDRSTFSALNIDGVARCPKGEPTPMRLVSFTPRQRPSPRAAAAVAGTAADGPAPAATAGQSEPPVAAAACEPSPAPSPPEEATPTEEALQSAGASETGCSPMLAAAMAAGRLPSGEYGEVRSLLLAFRGLAKEEGLPELEGLRAVAGLEREPKAQAPPQTPRKSSSARPLAPPMPLSPRQPRNTPKATSSGALPTPSEKAYRPAIQGTPKTRMQELRRTANSLLNKVCPESVATIADRLAEVEVADTEELELLISLIFQKALAEPHYCETYADLAFRLKAAYNEFPNPDGGKPVTFKATLLNICQKEFEALPTTLEPSSEEVEVLGPEEVEFRRQKTKARVLANMKFIGHLFLRQLLSAKVIGSVIQELVLCDQADVLPQEHVLECACELILSIGFTLDSMPAGSHALAQVGGRLKDLKTRLGNDGKAAYSKRMQFAIQDLLDIRAAGWTRKTFKSAAKTKEEIRLDQHRDLTAQARGREAEHAEQVVVGQRPLYLATAA